LISCPVLIYPIKQTDRQRNKINTEKEDKKIRIKNGRLR
jgi:hypothetical protein